MTITSPENLWSPDGPDPYKLTQDLAAMQESVQAAFTSVKGSIVYKAMTDAQRLALAGGNLFEGLTVWTTDTKIEWRYTSGAWVRLLSGGPFAMAQGVANVTASGTGGTLTVNLPAGRFTVPPIVMVSKQSGGLAKYVPYVQGATANSFTIGIYAGDGSSTGSTSIPVGWQAVQMTPSAAAG